MLRIAHIIICLLALLGISIPAMAQTDTLCVNATTNNYFVTNTSGSNYLWDTQGNGIINSGQGTANVNITWTQSPGIYLLNVSETSLDGCVGLPQQLSIVVLPAYFDTTNVTICENALPYIWNGISYATAGVYSIGLSNSAGCDSLLTLNLVTSPSLSGAFSNTACSGSGYSVLIGGTTYNEANPSGTETLISSAGCDSVVTVNLTFTPAQTGTFTYTSCSGSGYSVLIGATTYNEANPSGTETLISNAGCDSVVTVNLSFTPLLSGTEIISSCTPISWIDGNTYSTSTNTPTFTLTNAAGCDSVITLNLTIIQSFADTVNASICEGGNFVLPDGISVTASGTYTSNFQNQFGCDSIITTILSVDPQITLTLHNDTAICAGTTVDLIITGADAYSWTPADGLSTVSGDSVSASPSITTTYTIFGQTGTCTAVDSILVEVLPLPNLSVTPATVSVCAGDSILLTASGANSYTWAEASFFDCDTCTNVLLTPNKTTNVTLEGTIGICSSSVQIPVEVVDLPIAEITADTSICLGDTIMLQGNGGVNYLWNNGDTTAQTMVSPESNSSYTLIVDNGVCTDTTQIEIDVNPIPVANAGEDTTIRFGTTIQLNGLASDNFYWYPLDHLDCTFCLDPISSPPATIEYCLNVTNSFGCIANDCITITVDTLCANMFIPNVFAPDAGGHETNNCFRLYGGDCINSMSLKVFTRWGELVFETGRTGDCWDGTHKGKDLNPGVYIYYLDAELITGEKMSKQGNVTLIR